jgi:protein phosphatase
MKDLWIVLVSTAVFFMVLIGILVGVQKNIYRLPVYYLPNGLILNINPVYKDYWGQKLSVTDIEFAKELNSKFSFAEHEVRIYDKKQNEQIGRFFFITIKKFDILRYFLYDILCASAAFVIAIWFFYYIRDTFIFIFFLNISALLTSSFLYIAFDSFLFSLVFFLYLISFSIFNLSYRLRGKEIPTKWLIPQIILSGIMAFIAETEEANLNILTQVGGFGLIFLASSSLASFFSIVYDLIAYKQTRQVLWRKISLIVSFVFLTLPTLTILLSDPLGFLKFHRSFYLILFILFLISFIYGTYRYSLLPIQIVFSPTIITLGLIILFVGSYTILAFLLSQFAKDFVFVREGMFEPLFLLVTILYLIPVRSFLISYLDFHSFRKNKKLSSSLERISNLISSPISLKGIVNSINKNMMEALNVRQIYVLLPGDQFANTDLRNINFTRISSNSEIWKFMQKSKEVTVTAHLAYGVGFRESLFSYLSSMGVQIAFPVRDNQNKKQNKAILLIGEKRDKQNFSLGELRYIREVSRLISMLLDNYTLLAEDIEKKKIIRKLHTASILDHTLNLIDPPVSSQIKIGHISIPAVEISGDYLDFISIGPEKLAIFLGDVSGHGLGTGFIVTAIKAITRDQIAAGRELEIIFQNINLFLKEKYEGNEFMTLLGGILDIKKREFTYINAGHPGLLLISPDGMITQHRKTQRVLGIVDTEYSKQTLNLNPREKLIIYSDGVTETFGDRDSMFGEDLLYEFLRQNNSLGAEELPILLRDRLDSFRNGKDLSDDTSFVAIELFSEES